MTARNLRHYAAPATLKDGSAVLVRAIEASDKPRLLELFGRLSPESVRHRVFGVKNELTAKELAYLTEVDFEKHVGLVAMLREQGEGHMIGVGRYFRTHPHAAAAAPAEVAFAVVDEHQGRGVGTLLLEHLAGIAHDEGVDELDAVVMTDNAKMMEVFADSGFAVRRTMEDGIFHVAFSPDATESFVRAKSGRAARATKTE